MLEVEMTGIRQHACAKPTQLHILHFKGRRRSTGRDNAWIAPQISASTSINSTLGGAFHLKGCVSCCGSDRRYCLC